MSDAEKTEPESFFHIDFFIGDGGVLDVSAAGDLTDQQMNWRIAQGLRGLADFLENGHKGNGQAN
ncbi:hypothetical protein [Paraburkholderia sp. BL10I2N1]|uniref:hypothetical protein n=1 Tax=Paraburkholderia sp. BL10I2N1 TaxID=1938796 RepID=UPI00105B78F5|nr:hypothetical protein [Paraburkholderia sp. BL10I2N1]TDN70426.1 hypothetical protein B0G77_3900 [Paraburkholderia sp. BL10I2N1]